MAWLDGAARRRWFLPAVGLFPLTDYAVPVMPNQALLIALSVLHPQRWRGLAVTFVVAAGTGALLVAAVVQVGVEWLPGLGAADGSTVLQGVAQLTEQLRRSGLWALAGLLLLSALPWPPRVAVLIYALAGVPPWAIALTVTIGRVVPVTALAFTGARAPHLLRRIRVIDRLLDQVARR